MATAAELRQAWSLEFSGLVARRRELACAYALARGAAFCNALRSQLIIEWDEEWSEPYIAQNDRGLWALQVTPAGFNLVGYGGENHIEVLVSGMQDGSTDFVVVYRQVDSTMKVEHQLKARSQWSISDGQFVTKMISELYQSR